MLLTKPKCFFSASFTGCCLLAGVGKGMCWCMLSMSSITLHGAHTIFVHQMVCAMQAAHCGCLQASVFVHLLILAGAEGHNHRVPRKLHDIPIIQQNQVNDLQANTASQA